MADFTYYMESRVNPESVYLQAFRKNITSQCGEDGIIEKIFEIIGTNNKWCVEFGAWDGREHSNSWALINNHNWNGVLIEGNQDRFAELSANYADNNNVILINTFVDFENGENSLDSLVGNTPVPEDFDILCIDIDGCDWYIWESFTKYRPRLLEIEFNPTIPNHISFVQEKDMQINHGSSLRAMINLGKSKGYELVATTEWNAFFVPEEFFPAFNIEDNSIDSMHFPGTYETAFFQLYDGTVVVGGCTKLLWHNIEFISEDLQILPRHMRKYRG